jgi:hypothetical protein
MKLNKSTLVIVLAALSLQVCADQQEPAYWMKKYPEASQTKTQTCLLIAEEAYENAGGTQGRGDNGFAVLAKGTAWEKCMEGK